MTIKFKGRTKHGGLDLFPGVPLAFADFGAEDYFIAAGFADNTKEAPLETYAIGSVEIDPLTVFAETGKHVQPEIAAAAIELAQAQEG